MVMPIGSMVPPPNNPQVPSRIIDPINEVHSKEIRRKKGLSKAKNKSQMILIFGYLVLTFGMNGVTFGDYGFFVSTGVMIMLYGLLEALFSVAKYSK